MSSNKDCPCSYITPCSNTCSCTNPQSPDGCRRCCGYGSKEQRTDHAKRMLREEQELVDLRAAALLSALDVAFFAEGGKKIVVFLNDVFEPAADGETVALSEAPSLLEIHNREGYDGIIKWAARRRGIKMVVDEEVIWKKG